jgi:hypothetical protein
MSELELKTPGVAPMIYSAIPAAMADVDAIAKDRNNAQQGFKFRGIDDVYNSLHAILAKHKIFTVPRVVARESSQVPTKTGGVLNYEKWVVDYDFFAQDGSKITATVCGIGMDSGDKAGNKAMAIAHKYALLQVFCVPTEDEKDPDAQSHEVAAPAAALPSPVKPPAAPVVPPECLYFDGQVENVEPKTGTGAKGPWESRTVIVVDASGSRVAVGTFDKKLFSALDVLPGSDVSVKYTNKKYTKRDGTHGSSNELVDFKVLSEPADTPPVQDDPNGGLPF